MNSFLRSIALFLFLTLILGSLNHQQVISYQQATSANKISIHVALIKPVFTATAYSSFYSFFHKYAHTKQNESVTQNLELLNASIVDTWGWSASLYQFFQSQFAKRNGLLLGDNVRILTDIQVTEGALFTNNGSRNFDVVVLGFEEYVTAQEYYSFKQFVATGGVLIIMDATNFLAEVKYYPQTDHLALVKGHGWSFNGTVAKHDVYERWKADDTNWVGSNYCCYNYGIYQGAYLNINQNTTNTITLQLNNSFGRHVFQDYRGHEENRLTNFTNTEIIAVWPRQLSDNRGIIATYMHRYGRGFVIHFGVMGSDIISHDDSAKQFLILSIHYATVLLSADQPAPTQHHTHLVRLLHNFRFIRT